ncbi:MAG: hypothetical protein M3Y71_19880 [Actinomycetota bacterium]|nr:hypothetical protein [Actinomycetota bacterium]
MPVLVVSLLLCLALGSAVVAVVAMPARREGRDILSARGEEVFEKVRVAASATKERTNGLLSRKDDETS